MKIISPSRRVDVACFSLNFYSAVSTHGGFSFPCDEKGEVKTATMTPLALENLEKARAGVGTLYREPELRDESRTYREPAVGKCACGAEIQLGAFTNSCDRCPREYNMSGDLLAHRSQWGEETGERF